MRQASSDPLGPADADTGEKHDTSVSYGYAGVWGAHRVAFVVAMGITGLAVVIFLLTFLPGEEIRVPGAFFLVPLLVLFLMLFIGFFTVAGRVHGLLGGWDVVRILWTLPRWLKISYALLPCLAVVGILTSPTGTKNVARDGDEYYIPPRGSYSDAERTPVTEAEYHRSSREGARLTTVVTMLVGGGVGLGTIVSASVTAVYRRAEEAVSAAEFVGEGNEPGDRATGYRPPPA
ncbi:hypothetical protein GCM10027160_30250 [Streptomyces calidiresistens]